MTTPVDTPTALEASATWRRLGDLVPTIELYLEPRRGKSEVRMPPASKLPLDVVATDLLLELDQACDFYIAALMLETPDIKRFPDTLTARLHLVGQRFGHFTTATDTRNARVKGPDGKPLKDDNGQYVREPRTLGLDYCDEAHEYLNRTIALVVSPLPPQWLGPCRNCDGGELWMRPGRNTITCDQCKSAVDLGTWREGLMRALESRLMDREEILSALVILGHRVKLGTLRQWIHRGRLVPIIQEPERFRFADVLTVAKIDIAA